MKEENSNYWREAYIFLGLKRIDSKILEKNIFLPDVSRKITPIASTVLGFKNGGNTLIAVSPKGTKARDAARVGLGVVGNAPAPGVPGCGAPLG